MSRLRVLRAGADRLWVEIPPDLRGVDAAAAVLRGLHDGGVRGRIVWRQVVKGTACFTIVRMPKPATLSEMLVASGLDAPRPSARISRLLRVARVLNIDRCFEPTLLDLAVQQVELSAMGSDSVGLRLRFRIRAAVALLQAVWCSLVGVVRGLFAR